jgi:acetylornithine deacetylase/succinyl-diaminopimelate desuccinylase-like protein
MPPRPRQEQALASVADYLDEQGWQVLEEFISLLQIPNVTGSLVDLRVNAAELVRRFETRGASMDVVELPEASPVVVGELRCANPTATLGVYVHYDGHPIDPEAWRGSPFAASLVTAPWHQGGELIIPPGPGDPVGPEWRIYARGASDDKAPFAALLAALDALLSRGLERSVDLVFLFEEESGSPNLGRYMEHLAPRLRAQAWLVCDGPVHQSRKPQIAFGARGWTGFDLTFYGPERELHSGHYGNWVPNPAFDLITFLAGCKDNQGRVTIDGFYDDTVPMSEADQAAIQSLPPVEVGLLDELGFGGPEVIGSSLSERLMLPSFNIRGIRAAEVGDKGRNVIPAEATASVDIRLAAGDDPKAMLDRVQARLESQGYVVLDRKPSPKERRAHRYLARMTRSPHYRAVRTPMDSPLAVTLLGACGIAANMDVVALPTLGGSVPLYQFEEVLGSPVVVLPIANHDNNQHSADENIRIANLWYGVNLWATLLVTDFSAVRG